MAELFINLALLMFLSAFLGNLPPLICWFGCCALDYLSSDLVFGMDSVRVSMAVRCVEQHTTLRSTAQHTGVLQHNSTIGITYIPSIVPAAIGGHLR